MADDDQEAPAFLKDVGLPTPREDSVASIVAAHEFIEANDGATRAEIMEGLGPEKNHRVGITAAQLLGKLNEVEIYRDWWWSSAVAPGLRAHPDVEPPAGGGGRWRPNSDSESADKSDGDDTSGADIDALYSVLSDPAAPPLNHAAAAQEVLATLAEGKEVGARFVDPVGRLLTRPSLDADAFILRCLEQLARRHPVEVMGWRPAIAERVTLEEGVDTAAAIGCVAELVGHEPEAFIDLVPRMAALLDSDDDTIRANAIFVLAKVAREFPDEVSPIVPDLVEDIAGREVSEQRNVLSALGHITSAYPSAAEPAIEELADLVGASDAMVRANAAGVQADIATEHPELISPHAPSIVERLHDDDEHVRGNAVSAVLHIGVADRGAVADAIPALVELLDDPSPVVRRNVCKALGNLDAVVAIEQLRARADSDPDEGVRALADRAIGEIG